PWNGRRCMRADNQVTRKCSYREPSRVVVPSITHRSGLLRKSRAVLLRALNEAGYRTTGNRGVNKFSKHTVAEILTNRFYWGELPVYQEVLGAEDSGVTDESRQMLQAELERVRKLYRWGDLTEAEYLAERAQTATSSRSPPAGKSSDQAPG